MKNVLVEAIRLKLENNLSKTKRFLNYMHQHQYNNKAFKFIINEHNRILSHSATPTQLFN